MSEQLFLRSYKIQVKDLDVSNLKCVFRVKRSLRSVPNTAELEIYNLNPDHRRQLEQLPPRPDGVTLKQAAAAPQSYAMMAIEAGYESGTRLIYLGEVRSAHTVKEGADIITKLSTGDGEKEVRESRINVPIGPKASVTFALNQLVKSMGIGEGNLKTMAPKVLLNAAASMFTGGSVMSGPAADEMDGFCKSANLEWSIQNGNLQLLERTKPVSNVAVVLNSDTGLIGSPSIDNKGVVTFRTLMIPDIDPGRLVVFNSEFVKGTYRIDDAEYSGDTDDNDWYIDCKAALPDTAVVKHGGRK